MQTRDAQVQVPGSEDGGFHWSQAYGGVYVRFASLLFAN